MADIKAAIILAIKAKWPKVNLSKPRLNAIAERIEKKVIDDETKIDAELTTFNDYFPLEDIAKADDKIRNLEAKAKESKTPSESQKPEETPADQPADDPSMPPWAKALLEQNKTLTASLQSIQAEKQTVTMKSKAEAALKEVPVAFWGKRALPSKDDELEAFVADVQTDYKEFAQVQTDKGLGFTPKPVSGTNPANTPVIPAELKAYYEQKAIQEKAQPVTPVNNGMIIK